LICPSCAHDNIAGTDTCAECGGSLAHLYEEGEADTLGVLAEPLTHLNPRPAECVDLSTPMVEVMARLKGKNVGCVQVVDEDRKLVGIFTERDVLYKVAGLIKDLDRIVVESLMTANPTALQPQTAIQHALHLMSVHGFRHIPVIDEENRPVGIVSFRDVVGFIERHFAPRS
jgi:CBS domain-containing protein